MPAISGTCRPGRHSTPSVRVSSARNAAWNTSPAARACRYRSGWANAVHLPSAPSTRLAISTCQCSNGSPARLVRCRNAAPTTPDVFSRRGPTVDGSSPAATSSARFAVDPRRVVRCRAAPRSPRAPTSRSPRARRGRRRRSPPLAPAGRPTPRTARWPTSGTLNVASNPGTRLAVGRIVVPFGDSPPRPGRASRPARPADRRPPPHPSKPSSAGSPADPLPRRLAGTRVVGVERLGDPRQLVRLLADPQLRQRQHVGDRAPDEGPRPVPHHTRTPTTWVIICESDPLTWGRLPWAYSG